jgi:hypothetical protein
MYPPRAACRSPRLRTERRARYTYANMQTNIQINTYDDVMILLRSFVLNTPSETDRGNLQKKCPWKTKGKTKKRAILINCLSDSLS